MFPGVHNAASSSRATREFGRSDHSNVWTCPAIAVAFGAFRRLAMRLCSTLPIRWCSMLFRTRVLRLWFNMNRVPKPTHFATFCSGYEQCGSIPSGTWGPQRLVRAPTRLELGDNYFASVTLHKLGAVDGFAAPVGAFDKHVGTELSDNVLRTRLFEHHHIIDRFKSSHNSCAVLQGNILAGCRSSDTKSTASSSYVA